MLNHNGTIWNNGKNAFTSLSHDEQDFKLERLSFALAISEEPQHNLSPYIKAFDSSIIP
jgi:hypothetical protein